jgi:hypothetical protein
MACFGLGALLACAAGNEVARVYLGNDLVFGKLAPPPCAGVLSTALGLCSFQRTMKHVTAAHQGVKAGLRRVVR